ncbi:MAG: saccharopine dehydrogenase NADP-binding domain-containing protein, partial [Burkholderiales bacterium]
MTKEFDIVVHGATGFTGRLIAEYLLTRSDSGLKWAMGGRSMEKLQAVSAEIGAPASTPLLVIESSDEASLKSLMSKTRLVISAVGPYQLYGNELVKACAESGVD